MPSVPRRSPLALLVLLTVPLLALGLYALFFLESRSLAPLGPLLGLVGFTAVLYLLARIAVALERIADALEAERE